MPPRQRTTAVKNARSERAPARPASPTAKDTQTVHAAADTEPPAEVSPSSGFSWPQINLPELDLHRLRLPQVPEHGGKRLVWFAGLGALAAVGILEWPVALVVGAGSVVAERFARAASQAPEQQVPGPRKQPDHRAS
jgi:hypothetical protein